MNTIAKTTQTITIQDIEVEARNWLVSVGTAGAIGRAQFTVSKAMLKAAGVDLLSLSEASETPEVYIKVRPSDGNEEIIFGGVYDNHDIDHDNDTTVINALDWAARLVTEKRVLTDINYRNKTPSDIATEIAEKFGFTPKVEPTPGGVKAGLIFNRDAVFSSEPQPIWNVLLLLARDLAFEVRITPNKELIFAPVDPEEEPLVLHYKPKPGNDDVIPVRGLHTHHSPRRNKTFQVQVLSFRPNKAQVTKAQAVALGTEQVKTSGPTTVVGNTIISSISNNSIPSGVYWGAAGAGVKNQLSSSLQGKPVYTFRIPGLTPEQAQLKAASIAKEIAKRELVVTGVVAGRLDVTPQRPIVIEESEPDELQGYAGKSLAILKVEHSFSMNMPGEYKGRGFQTKFTALALPLGGTSDVAKALANWL